VPFGDVRREQLTDGRTRFEAGDASFVFKRLRPGVLLVTIGGNDTGQFGTHTLDEIRQEMQRHPPLELFVDARDAVGVALSVSEEWTRFFSLNRSQLSRVSVLVSSKLVSLTVAIAQHLSRTGNLIQIYSDPETFDARLAAISS
jgi:hypothetical protein